jgi:hypothetical protein
MGRPKTPDQIKAIEAAIKLAETPARKAYIDDCDKLQPTDVPAIAAPLPSLDPLAGQA